MSNFPEPRSVALHGHADTTSCEQLKLLLKRGKHGHYITAPNGAAVWIKRISCANGHVDVQVRVSADDLLTYLGHLARISHR